MEANEFGSAIHYLRGRYYSTALNRFLAEDPIGLAGGDTNLYRYVFNRPHVDYDPTGLGDEVVTLVGGVETDVFRSGSPFVVSVALGPGERFALQATLQSGVGAVGTTAYLGDPEAVSVNPVGGVPADVLVAQLGENYGNSQSVQNLRDLIIDRLESRLFEQTFETSKGPVSVLAEAELTGNTLLLRDIAIYPKSAARLDIGAAEVLSLRKQLVDLVNSLGLNVRTIRITGTRYSGGKPGKQVDLEIKIK